MRLYFLKKGMYFLFLISIFVSAGVAAVPRVVVSIPPLAALVQEIGGDTVSVDVLVKNNISPHFYTLKPSDRRKIDQANVLFWIGPAFEGFLTKVVENNSTKNVTLMDIDGLILHPFRATTKSCCAESGEKSDHEHRHTHHHPPVSWDGHLWLDPDNGYLLARAITTHLTRLNPSAKNLYEQRLIALKNRLDLLKTDLSTLLAPFRNYPFLIYHDGYQYFEKAFGLTGGRATHWIPDAAASAKQLVDLSAYVQQHQVRCLFAEAQFSPRFIQTIATNNQLRVRLLDPLGTPKIPYDDLLRTIGQSLAQCFKENF